MLYVKELYCTVCLGSTNNLSLGWPSRGHEHPSRGQFRVKILVQDAGNWICMENRENKKWGIFFLVPKRVFKIRPILPRVGTTNVIDKITFRIKELKNCDREDKKTTVELPISTRQFQTYRRGAF